MGVVEPLISQLFPGSSPDLNGGHLPLVVLDLILEETDRELWKNNFPPAGLPCYAYKFSQEPSICSS